MTRSAVDLAKKIQTANNEVSLSHTSSFEPKFTMRIDATQ